MSNQPPRVEEAQRSELRGTLNVFQITLLVVAAAAPLAAVIGTSPIAFMTGNGPGLAGTFLIAGVLLACFVLGYTELIRTIPGAGAFYRYLSVVFGERVGNGAAWVALIAYLALSAALATFCGYFTDLTLQGYGVDLGWQTLTALFIIVVGVLGRSSADFAAKVLVPMVITGFLMLIILAVAIVNNHGLAAFPYAAVDPANVFTKGFGVSIMIALASFIGVESSALYVQEAKDPARTIPRATLAAVIVIAVAYFLSIWVIVGDIGPQNITALAQQLQGDLVLQSFRRNTGEFTTTVTSLALCVSIFACYLALHNAATRYIHTLSSEGWLPKALSAIHPVRGAPANASLLTSVVVAISFAIPASMGLVPYAVLMPSSLALGTIGIIGLQAAVSFAVVVHFQRVRKSSDMKTLVLPLIAGLGLSATVVLMYQNYGLLTGSESIWVNSAPFVLVIVFAAGLLCRSRGGRIEDTTGLSMP